MFSRAGSFSCTVFQLLPEITMALTVVEKFKILRQFHDPLCDLSVQLRALRSVIIESKEPIIC